jgi:hypothetical protein
MTVWQCVVLVGTAGALGGILNAFLSDNGFVLPRREAGVLCPGFLSNVLLGAVSAVASWGLYGSGTGVELAKTAAAGSPRIEVSLTLGALVGALVVGVGGARWITNEADKRLLKESVRVAGQKSLTSSECAEAVKGSPRKTLERIQAA